MAQRVGPVTIEDKPGEYLTILEVPQEAVGFVPGRQESFLHTIEEEWNVFIIFAEFEKK